MSKGLRLCLGLLLLGGLMGSGHAAEDRAGKPTSEIEALRRRLTDASCHAGPIDGRPGADLGQAIDACASQAPPLRIEAGMPVASIKRIGVAPDMHATPGEALGVDGAKVLARGLARIDGPSGSVTMALPAHDATVSLIAYAGGLAGEVVRVDLKHRPEAVAVAQAQSLKPNLYALLIGVTHYEKSSYDLKYPAKDATELAAALQAQQGRLYGAVEVKVLTDKDATRTGIEGGLSWLSKQATARDLAVVFADGQGTTDVEGNFWFLPSDMNPDDIAATAVSRDDIAKVLDSLPGKKLLFLDACHAGAALTAAGRGLQRTDVNAAINDFALAEGGVVAYGACTGREISQERDDWGHGAFTKALIEGLDGQADLLHTGRITTAMLDVFIAERVKILTGGRQHPVMSRPQTVPDFLIALVP